MKTKINKFPMLILIFILLITACGQKEDQSLPHYGVFLRKGGDLVQLIPVEIVSTPTERQLGDLLSTDDNQPVFAFWDPDLVLQYLQFYSVTNGDELRYDVTPIEDEVVNIRPSDPLDDGVYCFIQGNPIVAFLNAWCFRIGKNSVDDGDEESSTLVQGPSFCPNAKVLEINTTVKETIKTKEVKCFQVELDSSQDYIFRINTEMKMDSGQYPPVATVYDQMGNAILDAWGREGPQAQMIGNYGGLYLAPEYDGTYYLKIRALTQEEVPFIMNITDDTSKRVSNASIPVDQISGEYSGGSDRRSYEANISHIELSEGRLRVFFDAKEAEGNEGISDPLTSCIQTRTSRFERSGEEEFTPIDSNLEISEPGHYKGYLDFPRNPDQKMNEFYVFQYACSYTPVELVNEFGIIP